MKKKSGVEREKNQAPQKTENSCLLDDRMFDIMEKMRKEYQEAQNTVKKPQ